MCFFVGCFVRGGNEAGTSSNVLIGRFYISPSEALTGANGHIEHFYISPSEALTGANGHIEHFYMPKRIPNRLKGSHKTLLCAQAKPEQVQTVT
ncbi:hypothetical protein CIL05_19440 [Virgibacillus profundi]|uniref:Uncharacterized protein n=1 Tax=Virgibacillus profundi TaxID=2024555 RepID=A0A2A2I878_9BACI|nr:hypothetical protein CIL05_19440 [Virgibacillus profundi]PXY52035.1 hypothetical protein CIT14_19545 [Virgibacillus profundi]